MPRPVRCDGAGEQIIAAACARPDEQADLLAAESLLDLGLPARDPYWSSESLPWTMRKAFAGEPFAKDYYVDY